MNSLPHSYKAGAQRQASIPGALKFKLYPSHTNAAETIPSNSGQA